MTPHKAEACARLSPIGQRLFRFIEFDDNEELITEIRKHPLGLFFIWVMGLFIAAAIIAATSLLALKLGDMGLGTIDGSGTIKTIIVGLGLLLGAFSVVMTVISSFIYKSSVIFVTNEKIAEVVYTSIFNRRIWQLGIGNVEDATVTQKGILPRLFNYGGIVIETAGEATNPAFAYVPRPNDYSQVIIRAHEQYVEKYGN
jgi:hypothetical protein